MTLILLILTVIYLAVFLLIFNDDMDAAMVWPLELIKYILKQLYRVIFTDWKL